MKQCYCCLVLIHEIWPGLPRWLSGKESACQYRRCKFNPWVEKIPWSRKRHPTPGFLPEKSQTEELGRLHTVHGAAKNQTRLSTAQHEIWPPFSLLGWNSQLLYPLALRNLGPSQSLVMECSRSCGEDPTFHTSQHSFLVIHLYYSINRSLLNLVHPGALRICVLT